MSSSMPTDEFLLRTNTARRLYEDVARDLRIIDFHCHLDPSAVVEDRQFNEIADLWVTSDVYKSRAMRLNGIPERIISGNVAVEDRFAAWAGTLPRLVGNPLFHWSMMELRQFFGVTEALCPANAERVRRACNERLASARHSPRSLLRDSGVEQFCTSDDWTDSLEHHAALKREAWDVTMLPSLRSDKAWAVDSTSYLEWIKQLDESTGISIDDLDAFQRALINRLDHFDQHGCPMADHGLSRLFFNDGSETKSDALFTRVLRGEALDTKNVLDLQSSIQMFLMEQYARRGWALQLHVGAERNTSSRLRQLCGPAGGYACIGRSLDVRPLVRMFDVLEQRNALPRTIIYPLNPADFEMLASLTGSFAEDGVAGKIQLGPAWWYNDHVDGIRRQLRAVASYSLLGRFVGMTTDSRSFLSMVRHDFFRRLLCDQLGTWISEGSLPEDEAILQPLVRDICYENPKRLLQS